MKTQIVQENQTGFLFRNGKYEKTVGAGKYRLFGGKTIEVRSIDSEIRSQYCPQETIFADPANRDRIELAEVGDGQMALHFADGIFCGVYNVKGKYGFWKNGHTHTFRLIDLSHPEVPEDLPPCILQQLPPHLYTKIEVAEHQKARLYFDRKLVRVLDAGCYYFWNSPTKVTAEYADTRLTQMNIAGQEVMTQDKVALRINVVCTYRITDCVKIVTEIDNYAEQLHIALQLALRDYVGKYKLDEILADKEALSAYVFQKAKEKESSLFVEITEAGVKDIILPGEIRDIMNTVLIAEKKAQAGVITRREEVASTRSLLNTARLMEENATLYRLKELEYIERICENVGSINLNGNGDMLSQLLTTLGRKEAV